MTKSRKAGLLAAITIAAGASMSVQAELTQNRLVGSTLAITSDAGDAIIVTVVGGNVMVNGADPENVSSPGQPVAVSDVRKIAVVGGPGDNVIDLGGFPGGEELDPLQIPNDILGGGGDDTIVGSAFRDFIDGGPGTDTIDAGPENDQIEWVLGGGADEIDGGEGFDTVLVRIVSSDVDPFSGVVENGEGTVRFRATSGNLDQFEFMGTVVLDILGGIGPDSLTVGALTDPDLVDLVFAGGQGDDMLDASASGLRILGGHNFGDGSDTLLAGTRDNDQFSISAGGAIATDTYDVSEDDGLLKIATGGQHASTLLLGGFESIFIDAASGNDIATIADLGDIVLGELRIFMGLGDDLVTVQPSPNVEMGMHGQGHDSGDSIVIDVLGLPFGDSGTRITIEGYGSIAYSEFESVDIIGLSDRFGDQWEL